MADGGRRRRTMRSAEEAAAEWRGERLKVRGSAA